MSRPTSIYPIGIALGTVKAASWVEYSPRAHLTICCDDPRWLGCLTEVYLHRGRRLPRFFTTLHAHDLDSLVGQQGRFVYDTHTVTLAGNLRTASLLVWGLPRRRYMSPALADYLKSCTLEQVEAIRKSPGVLPFAPEHVSIGVYR